MQPSRRAFIAATAAIPAAAAVPALAATPIEATAIPAPATPYVEYPWRWMVSHDDYCFGEDFDTFAKALEFAKAEGAEVIAECQMQDFDLTVDGDSVLEMLLGMNEDLLGEGEFLDPKKEQTDDLGKMVTAAIEAWAVKHRISLTAWTFAGMRNKTKVADANGESA